MCSCASNKASRVGKAAVTTAIEGAPDSVAGAISGATSTAIGGGQVLQGARQGVAPSAANGAGSTAGAIVRELLK